MLYRADKLQGCTKLFASEAYYAIAQDEEEAADMLEAGFFLTSKEALKPKRKKAASKVAKIAEPKSDPEPEPKDES